MSAQAALDAPGFGVPPDAFAAAVFDLFDHSDDLVGLVGAEPPHAVVYLNPAAERYVSEAGGAPLGKPLDEVFERISDSPLKEMVARAAVDGSAQRARALPTRPGSAWHLDVIPFGGHLLLVGRALDPSSAMRDRLERLLESTDRLWLNADPQSLAGAVVATAADLLPTTACSLSLLVSAGDDHVLITAGSEPWLCVGTPVPLAGSYSGRAIASRTPVEGPIAAADAAHRDVLAANGVRRMRVIPLLSGEDLPDGRPVLGVLSFMRRSEAPYDADERRLMDEFGKRASIALDRAELVRRERAHAARLAVGLEAALALGASLSPRAVVDELLRRVVNAVGADRATLSTIDGGRITIQATFSGAGEALTWSGQSYDLSFIEGQPLVKQALDLRQPVLGGSLRPETAAPEFRPQLEAGRHTATVPLVRGDHVEGLLVATRNADPTFSTDDIGTLSLIGHAAMLALNNARLHEEMVGAHAEAAELARSLQVGIETALDLGHQLEHADLVERLLERATAVAAADRAVLMAVDGDELVVEDSLTKTPGSRILPGTRISISQQPLIARAVRTGVAQQGSRVALRALPAGYRKEIAELGGFASVPLQFGGTAIGVLNLSRYRAEPFTEQQLRALTLLGQVGALAIRNARLFEELREASAAKSEFLNLAAHQLRTPISIVRGYLSMFADETLGRVPEGWVRPLEVVAAKSTELNEIVEELLSAARIQAGSFLPEAQRFDLVALTRQAVDAAQPAATLAGGEIRLRKQPAELWVEADPGQIRRVLDNLLGNAVVYSGGAPRIAVELRRRRSEAVVAVADRGPGIAEDARERIFERFVRLESPRLDASAGTGLGLYIARGLARANGGEVRVARSAPGEGSVFELSLPAG